MSQISYDLETWGLTPGSAIRSIGAVAFDLATGEKVDEFYVNVSDESCLSYGLTQDPKTVQWWSEQSVEAQAIFVNDQQPLPLALFDFGEFYRRNAGEDIWSYGANADTPWLEAAYRAAKMDPPWHYRAVRCARTITEAAGTPPDRTKGVHHYALDDARNQADAIHAAHVKLGLAMPAVAEVVRDGAISDFLTGRTGALNLRWTNDFQRIEWEFPVFGTAKPFDASRLVGRGAPRVA